MDKSKKIIFFITMLMTIVICCVILKIINNSLKPAQEYMIHSGIGVANNDGALDGMNYKIESFFDEQDKLKMNIDVYNYNERNVKYQLSILVNYQQREFQIDEEKMLLYDFDLESDNNHKFNIVLNKDIFKYKANDMVVILRQDIDIYSVDNELVSDSNTICRHYIIMNNASEKNINKEKGKIKLSSVNDNVEMVVKLECLNVKSSYGIQIGRGKKLKFRLNMKNGVIGTDYTLVCLQEGKQAKIDDKLYLINSGNKGEMNVYAPNKKGKYELEVLCIPTLGNIKIDEEKEVSVISSNRYTLEVE